MFGQEFETQFWKLQTSPNETAFRRRKSIFDEKYPHAGKYLQECPSTGQGEICTCAPANGKHSVITLYYHMWALFLLHEQGVMTWDCRTSNYSESENSRLLAAEIRNATPLKMFMKLVRDVSRKANNARLQGDLWTQRKNVYTPVAQSKIRHVMESEAGKYAVRWQVHSPAPFQNLRTLFNCTLVFLRLLTHVFGKLFCLYVCVLVVCVS